MKRIRIILVTIIVLASFGFTQDCISGMTSKEIESKVSALLSKMTLEDLSFINRKNMRITEPGEFEITIGELKSKFSY